MRIAAEVRFTSWQVFSLIYSINISQGGMSLELPREEKVGERLRVKLTLPKGPPLELEATVRHCTAHGKQFTVGVQFVALDDATKKSIEQSIRANGGMLSSSLTPRK
jgi:hypothetical protein